MFINPRIMLKYITNNVENCISLITGSDLYLTISIIKSENNQK